MASRSMRSRFPTPLSAPPLDALSAGTGAPSMQQNATPLTEWQEPPIRPPAPSFEDYKGLERQGVLEFMQPLGTVPTQRVKLRTKPFDSVKRSTYVRNGEPMAAGSEDMGTPDPAPPPPSRRSESRKAEDRTSRLSASRVKEEDSEYTPNGALLGTPSKAVLSYPSHRETPSPQVSARSAKLEDVVRNAVKQADGKGDPLLGQALNRLYKQSFDDPLLLDVIEAVLSRRPSENQNKDFKKYLRGASKEIRRESGIIEPFSPARGTSSDPKLSPIIKNGRDHVPSVNSTAVETRRHGGSSTPTSHPHSPSKSTRRDANSHAKNTPSGKKQAVPDRSRRSSSTSSLSSVASSLSSVDPNLALQGEEEFGGGRTPQVPSAVIAGGGRINASAGPKMGTFIISNANKRSFASTNANQEDEELAVKRRRFERTFPDYKVKDSDVRTAMLVSADKTKRALPKVQHPAAEVSRVRNGMELRGKGDDLEELDSPTTSMHSDLLIPPPAFAGSSRRGMTPTNLGRPPKSTKKSARVKMSPLKKKNGVVAGMPRLSGGRNSPIGSSQADGEGPNSDECSSCGGTGELLCCDGCTRSFHFTCIDPPKDTLPDGEWYCRACAAHSSLPPPRRIFPILVHSFKRTNPRAFNLPRSIREYFDDVFTGDDGEYEEASSAAPSKAKTRTGYDLPLDTLKLKDAKDNIILCFSCQQSAMGRREMINCDFCNLYWHLDCVNPPLASAPKKSGKGTWKCPNHVDSEVAVPRSASGKVYKPRRPRNPRVIQPALSRGTKNNGFIEIEDEISEEEDQPPGTIYRIPASAIKLDFITKIKRSYQAAARASKHEPVDLQAEERHRRQQQQHTVYSKDSLNQDTLFQGRSSAEREAAVNLAQFAHSDPNSQLRGGRVEELVRTLFAEAPVNVNGIINGDHTYSETNGDNPVCTRNGNLPIMKDAPNHANAASSNKAAFAVNHGRCVENLPSAEPEALLAEEEDILRLEAIVQRRKALIQKQIANMRSITPSG